MELTSTHLYLYYTLLVGVATSWTFFRWYYHPLRSIPAMGPTFPPLSYIGAFRFLRDAPCVLKDGCSKYYGKAFRVATLDGWVVVLSGAPLIEDLRRRPEEELSFKEGAMNAFHLEHTLNKENDLHVEIIRGRLTRNLHILCPSLVEEIGIALKAYLLSDEKEWTTVPALEFSRKVVSRVNSRIFVGDSLCRDASFLELTGRFRTGVIISGFFLSFVPRFMKPILGRLVRRVRNDVRQVSILLHPIIERTRKRTFKYDDSENVAHKSNNLLQWLSEDASLTPLSISERIMLINLASIEPTANTFTSALYYLGASPDLVESLRSDVKPIVEKGGWTTASIDKMWKLDSFLKENQRINIDYVTFIRKAKKDLVLSDGSYIPAGTTVAIASGSAHNNPTKYPNPDQFDPFRFSRLRLEAGVSPQYQWINASADYLAFGYGRHACPGRFFAAMELKAMLACVLLHYDVTLEPEAHGQRPENVRLGPAISPSMTAKVRFRRRQINIQKT